MADEIDTLVVCKDLFFSSQLHGAVQRAGRKSRTCLSQEGCLSQISALPVKFVIVDLELPDLNLSEIRAAVEPGCQLIAFGPHVREDLFRSAQEAGCDLLLTRGQACAEVERRLK